jgi:capsule polysaccharide export protein KpsE/RkpR
LKARQRRRRLWRVLSIGVPTLLASLYYGLIASDRYVSDTQMVLSQEQGAALTPISSDFLSRLPRDASQEDFNRYYKRHVEVIADPTDPVIELQVQAFTPADAQRIAKTLVSLAQQKLNEAYVEMERDALAFARSEVDQAQQRLKRIDNQLRDFRNAHGELDLTANSAAVGTVIGGLFAELASTEADLKTALSYAREDNPTVTSLQSARHRPPPADRGGPRVAGRKRC